MLSTLLTYKRWPIALDIGTDSIKMLQMQSVGGGLGVRASARLRLPASAPREGDAWRQLVVASVRDMLRKGGFRGDRAISSLPCDQLKIKNVRLPKLSGPDLEKAVHIEASSRFGCSFAPDQLHYLPAGEVRQGQETCQEIILLGAPGDLIENHYSMLLEMGLRPVHIDAEPLAMFRPFERRLRRRADEGSSSVVVDLGHTSTKIVIARGRHILLIKRIRIGGRNFAEAVAKQLNLPYEEAFDLRIQVLRGHSRDRNGDSEAGAGEVGDPNSVSWTIVDAIRGEVEELAREIALCLRYCSVTFRGLRPKEITLTGGQAYDSAMVQLLEDQLGLPCEVGQPLHGVDTSGVDLGGDRRGMLAEWSVCAGLAFRAKECERTSRKDDHERNRLSA